MIDAHIHYESQPYTKAGLMKFVDAAQKQGLDSIMILEHTHRFLEWAPLYEQILGIDTAQDNWYRKEKKISIRDYQKFITKMRQEIFPITIRFGLEVCYFHEKERFIETMLHEFPYDFAVGSIHFVNHIAYDNAGFSKRLLWDQRSADQIYQEYYHQMEQLIKSDLFQGLAHPDTIKMFHILPDYDLNPTYHRIAKLLSEHNMYTENNVGCYYRYHHEDLGLSDEFLTILLAYHVRLLTASDAHFPKYVGLYINDAVKRIQKNAEV